MAPCSSDQLSRRQRNGASRSIFSYRSHVGHGSDEQYLSGSEDTSAIKSAGVVGENSRSPQTTNMAVKTGGLASTVATRTSLSLLYRSTGARRQYRKLEHNHGGVAC